MSDYDDTLLEDMNHKLAAILEGQQAMASVPGDIAELKTDMNDVKSRLANVEFAVTDMSKDIRHLDKRVGSLEDFVHGFPAWNN